MGADNESARFDALVDSYYRAWFRFHPEAAVESGVSGFDRLLTPFRPDELGPLVCLNDELLVGLDEIDERALDDDRRLDATLLRGAAVIENTRILEVDPRRVDPQCALPINAIYQLTICNVADPIRAMAARISAIPEHMEAAREYFHNVAERIPPLWLTAASTSARAGAAFIAALPANPDFQKRFGVEPGARAFSTAAQAILGFAEYLDQELAPRAAGDVACGKAYFMLLLQQRHALDVAPEEIRHLGQALFEQTARDLADACKAIGVTGGTKDALATTGAGHPLASELIRTYRDAMLAARAFVQKHDLVTLPAVESLDVVETPAFLRHQIPFAAYQEPMPTDAKQRGFYYVTPPASEDELAKHDRASLQHTCVHEAWPGHHLQFVTANLNPAARSLPRLLNPSATLYEGWALYCEQLMYEQGFLNTTIQRVHLLRDRLWRALRILIDVDLHTGDLSVEAAADQLVTHLGFSRSQAMAEITWYSRAPTVPLGYATGWSIINALRDRTRAEMGESGARAFHDRLLSVGSVALPLVIQRAFGKDRWATVRGMLFRAAEHVTA